MLIRAYLVSGEFRVHRADCRDCTREARRSDSSAAPGEFPSKAAVIRSLWSDIIAEDPGFYGTPDGMAGLEAAPSSCPAPAGSPGGGSSGPAPRGTAAGGPRAGGDGIVVDIATRAGLVTVQFTGRGHARAGPAAGQAFTYRGRQYAGSVFLSGPGWHGSSGLGLSLHPAGGPAGRSVAETIAGIVGAAVAAYLRAHPEI